MSSLNIDGKQANFEGKANIQDVTDPENIISVAGNGSLMVDMTDNGDEGENDLLAITLYDMDGSLWYSSAWDDTQTIVQAIGGGNIKVNGEGGGGKATKNARTTDNGKIASSVEDMLGEEAGSFSFSYQA